MSFHGLIALFFFFFTLNNVPSLSIHLLKDILAASKFWKRFGSNYEWSCYKRPRAAFVCVFNSFPSIPRSATLLDRMTSIC